MRRYVCVGAILIALVVAIGCRATPAFVRGVDAGWQEMGPEYKAYVEGDPQLSDSDRATRLRTAELMDRLIAEEKAR